MKRSLEILSFLIYTLALISCEGKVENKKGAEYRGSAAFKLVIEHIDSMGVNPWNKAGYLAIRDRQIPQLKRESEQKSATELLSTTYGSVLVRDISALLSGGCSAKDAHSLLAEMISELKDFSEVKGYNEVVSAYNRHNTVARFARGPIGRQSVSSYSTTYDVASERNAIAKAKSYLADSLVRCVETRKKLERLSQSSAYHWRRKYFCESIVEHYLECVNPDKVEYNIALSRLNAYSGDKTEWEIQLLNHYNEIQPKDTIQ